MVPFKFPITLPYIIRLFGILQFHLYSEAVLQHPVNLYFYGLYKSSAVWCVAASNTVSHIKLSHFLDLSLQQEIGFCRSPSASRLVYFYSAPI